MFLKVFLCLFFIISLSGYSEETENLTLDRSISNGFQLAFPNDENISPKHSEFKILNYALMSNDAGERWSVITLTNLSSGIRSLENTHLTALFADGTRRNPLEYKLNFKGHETQSITVSFGKYKFPILTIYASNDK